VDQAHTRRRFFFNFTIFFLYNFLCLVLSIELHSTLPRESAMRHTRQIQIEGVSLVPKKSAAKWLRCRIERTVPKVYRIQFFAFGPDMFTTVYIMYHSKSRGPVSSSPLNFPLLGAVKDRNAIHTIPKVKEINVTQYTCAA
jgi:hypothetical protein